MPPDPGSDGGWPKAFLRKHRDYPIERRALLSWIADGFQGGCDLIKDGRILDGRRCIEWFAVGDAGDGAAQDLARASLGQAIDDHGQLERGDGADSLAHAGDAFGNDVFAG